jgi:hypothetical protein
MDELTEKSEGLQLSTFKEDQFRSDLASVLNRHCRENYSNTPDFILAEYLICCLKAYEEIHKRRENWYGREFRPGVIK